MINTNSRTILPALALSVSAIIASPMGYAQDSDVSDAVEAGTEIISSAFSGWRGTATLGATTSSGNAEASNINGSIRLGKTVGRWEHLAFGSIFKGTSSIVIEDPDEIDDDGRPVRRIIKGDNSDRLALGYQPKYFLSDRTYAFGILDWEQDKPADIDSSTRQIIGIGHQFFSNESGFLSAEVGIGNKNTELVSGGDVDGGIGYLGLNYLNRINENVTFNADLRSDFGSDNTFVELGLGVAFKISEKLALKVSHFSRSNSDLDSGDNPLSSSSDSVTTMNLVIDI
ncbi:MAG: YdiY family protein [Granulosicoccus sp.]